MSFTGLWIASSVQRVGTDVVLFLKIIFQIPENKLVDPNFVVIFSLLATVSLGGFIFTKTR